MLYEYCVLFAFGHGHFLNREAELTSAEEDRAIIKLFPARPSKSLIESTFSGLKLFLKKCLQMVFDCCNIDR